MVYDIREFNTGTAIDKLIKEIDGEIHQVMGDILERPIYGYTIVDSLRQLHLMYSEICTVGLTKELFSSQVYTSEDHQ